MQYLAKHHINRSGFTIVELLIVIVVIAILATISIVAYRGIQERARASQVITGIAQAKKKLELYKVDNGNYPTTGNLAAADVKDADVSYQYTSDGSSYCITGTVGTTSYKATNTGSAEQGGCAGHGQGGVAAVTNLATNPSVETSGAQWTARWYGGSGGTGTTSLTSAAALFGTMGYRKTWTAGGGGNDVGFSYLQPTVVVGTTYTFSGHFRSSAATSGRAWVYWQDGSGTQVGATLYGTSTSVSAGSWQRLSVSGTAPAGATKAVFVWGTPGSGAPNMVVGQTMDFDGIMITEDSQLYPYADGSSPNWIWNGTPNGSTSTGPPL